ncbi:MAG: hypothetical protein IPL61_29310 [Myxococcales bacterium]|nr:hypothetical protein [Myxococcales bacterium]
MTRGLVAIAVLVGAAAPATAEPIGALIGGSEVAFGGGPRQRVNATAIAYLTRRAGGHVSVSRLALDGASGAVTAGFAYRANAARPRLELVVHVGAGVAWPTAPVAAAGVTAFLWPTRFPIAVTTGVRVYAFIDDVAPAPLALSLELGLALAR